MPASLPGGAVLAWERVEVCGPRLISGLVGLVAQKRHAGWPGCILYRADYYIVVHITRYYTVATQLLLWLQSDMIPTLNCN